MTTITVRRARPSDAEGYAALMNDPLVYPNVLQLPYTDAEAWRQRLTESGGSTVASLSLVALADDRVIGSAGMHSAGTAVRRHHAMGIGMGIAGDWQGRGIGSRLLEALCQHADRWVGVLRLELTVYTDNARAIALYRRFGFEIEGTHRAFALRDGVYVDALAMARLHPNPPTLR